MATDGAPPLAPAGKLVGREGDLAAIDQRFAEGERLVTVTGPGGIGKSRLAAEVVDQRRSDAGRDDLAGPAWIADLSEVTGLPALCDVVAEAVALPGSHEEPDAADPVARIGEALSARGPALLVLDDVDHVNTEAGEAAARWLSAAAEVQLLVTCRERLHVADEAVHELAPLTLDGPGGPSASEALAIELAAARLAVMGPRALLHRLRTGLDALRRTERGGPARHATLAQTIDWSWQLLQPWEQDALAQCSTFRGGFSLEAAEAVISVDGHSEALPALDVIQALRDKSFLHASEVGLLPGELRLGMYVAIRQLAAFFVAAGERWSSAEEDEDTADPRRHLIVERENLLAVAERVLGRGPVTAATAEPALKALLVLWPVLLVRGPLATYAKLMGPVLDVSAGSGADPSLQADALAVRGSLRWHRGQSQEGLGDLIKALAIARKLDNRRLEGRVLVHLGKALADRGELDEARGHCDGALAIHRELGDEAEEGRALAMMGQLEARRGRHDDARRLYERALAIHGRVGDAVLEAQDRRLLGELLLGLDQREEAQSCLDSAAETARRLGDRRGEAIARGFLALLHHDGGDIRRARRGYEEVAEHLGRLGFRRLEGVFTGYLAILERESGRWMEAYTLLERALDLVGDDDAEHRSLFLAHLGGLDADAGRTEEARELLEAADGSLGASAPTPTPFRTAIALQRFHLSTGGGAAALREAEGPAASSAQVRIAVRCLRGALEKGPERGEQRPMEDALIVGAGGLWLRPPGGERVSLKQRRPLRLLVERLSQERLAEPGHPLSWEDLLAAGWPQERVIPSAGAHRVRVAISTLRKLGLREVLITVPEGYLFDVSVDVHLLEEGDSGE